MTGLARVLLLLAGLGFAFAMGLAGAWYLGGGSRESREGSQSLAGGLEQAPGGRFLLTDQAGRAVDSSALGGRYLLLYFGYTQCNDACPVAMLALSDALEGLSAAELERVAAFFVIIDPEVDGAAELARYLESFHPAIRALSGEAEAIAAAASAYRVGYDGRARETASGDRVIDHGSSIYLMGPDGAYLRKFDYDVAPERLRAVVRGYLAGAADG